MLKSLVLRPNRSLRSKSRPNSSLSAIDETSRPPFRPAHALAGPPLPGVRRRPGSFASSLILGSRSRPRYGLGAFSRSRLSLPTNQIGAALWQGPIRRANRPYAGPEHRRDPAWLSTTTQTARTQGVASGAHIGHDRRPRGGVGAGWQSGGARRLGAIM